MEDKRNIDAGIELAFLAPNKQETIKILEEAAERGNGYTEKMSGRPY